MVFHSDSPWLAEGNRHLCWLLPVLAAPAVAAAASFCAGSVVPCPPRLAGPPATRGPAPSLSGTPEDSQVDLSSCGTSEDSTLGSSRAEPMHGHVPTFISHDWEHTECSGSTESAQGAGRHVKSEYAVHKGHTKSMLLLLWYEVLLVRWYEEGLGGKGPSPFSLLPSPFSLLSSPSNLILFPATPHSPPLSPASSSFRTPVPCTIPHSHLVPSLPGVPQHL